MTAKQEGHLAADVVALAKAALANEAFVWNHPVLYTDTTNGGKQACRDDLWAITTEDLNAIKAALEVAGDIRRNALTYYTHAPCPCCKRCLTTALLANNLGFSE